MSILDRVKEFFGGAKDKTQDPPAPADPPTTPTPVQQPPAESAKDGIGQDDRD
ncbi:MAG TPA: hypothetical protein VGX25_11525 [Actinophytocola sp.]|uniref:hypothetical protein n=1 Tax=Actinophytocola sp. TaxID=1872138 RepID=UPI002DDD8C07|nr:hypothetical protein [Actinophytocola sp.]HEV2780014.1 hypothetical protein [Actinophytocola sp.]